MIKVQTAILTADGQAKATGGLVHWVSVSAGATGGAFQLNDSTDDSGTDRLNIAMPASSAQFFDFSDRPIEFNIGIYVDVPGTNLTVNVGYT